MADCPSVVSCPFFNDRMSNKPALAEILKQRYCKGDNKQCARFVVFRAVGKGNVPADLYPNQSNRVAEIIAAKND